MFRTLFSKIFSLSSCFDTDSTNTNSQVIGTTQDIHAIIAQRNRLQEVLMQRDITIEHLLSKGRKLDTQSSEAILRKQLNGRTRTDKQIQSDGEICVDNIVQTDNGGSSSGKSRKKSTQEPSKLECEHLTLQSDLLKDLNKSLKKENKNLKTANRILQNSYDIIKKRMERLQNQHQVEISNLHFVNQILKSSMGNDVTKKRPAQHDDYSNSQKKRRRADQSNRLMEIEYAKGCSGSESEEDSIGNDRNLNKQVAQIRDIHDTSDDDLILIE